MRNLKFVIYCGVAEALICLWPEIGAELLSNGGAGHNV